MSLQPMPSARTSMSLWSLWKSSTITFTAARVAGLGSVSHMVTVTFFWAPAGRAPPTRDSAVAPAAAPPSRARNWRRFRIPALCSPTSRRRPRSLCQDLMVVPLSRLPRARAAADIRITGPISGAPMPRATVRRARRSSRGAHHAQASYGPDRTGSMALVHRRCPPLERGLSRRLVSSAIPVCDEQRVSAALRLGVGLRGNRLGAEAGLGESRQERTLR